MKKNLGGADRLMRTLIALGVGDHYFADRISGILAIVLGVFAVVFLPTRFVSWRPLYVPFGPSTGKRPTASHSG